MAIEIEGGAIRDKYACLYNPPLPPHTPTSPFQRPYLISVQHLPNCSSALPVWDPPLLLHFSWFRKHTQVLGKWGFAHILWDMYWLLCAFLTSKFSKTWKVHTVAWSPHPTPSLPPLSREYFHKLNWGGKLPQQPVNWNTPKCFSQHTFYVCLVGCSCPSVQALQERARAGCSSIFVFFVFHIQFVFLNFVI